MLPAMTQLVEQFQKLDAIALPGLHDSLTKVNVEPILDSVFLLKAM
jgi:hypothetical protein